jgi:malonate transporter and related proteins
MLEIAVIIMPIFLTICIGYLTLHLKILTKDHIKVLGHFIIKVSIPILLLVSISSQDFHSLVQIPYLISYGVSSLIVFLTALIIYIKIFREGLTQASVMSMGSSMSNTVYIGSGILYLFLGEKAAIYFGMTFLIENFLILLLFLICLELDKQTAPINQILIECFVNVIKNPIVIALISGLLLSSLEIRLPEFLQQILKPIGQTSTPLGLLVIGGSLYGLSLSSHQKLGRDIATIAGLKLILMPLLVYGLFQLFPNATSEMVFAGVLLSSISMVGIFAVFGQQFDMQKVPPILMTTTLLCIINLSFIIRLLHV